MFSDWSHVWLQNKLSFNLFEVRAEFLCPKQNKTLRINKLIQQRGRMLGQQKNELYFYILVNNLKRKLKKQFHLQK